MTPLSYVALHGIAHNFTELDKAVVHVIRLYIYLSYNIKTHLHMYTYATAINPDISTRKGYDIGSWILSNVSGMAKEADLHHSIVK